MIANLLNLSIIVADEAARAKSYLCYTKFCLDAILLRFMQIGIDCF